MATASGNKGRCDLSYNSQNNEYLVVWGDTRTGSNVYGQRLNATAGLIGGDFAISAAANSEVGPAVEYSTSSSEYLAVWWRYYDASDWDIYGGRVSATGGPVGGRFGISTANEVQRQPDLAYNTSNGQFLIDTIGDQIFVLAHLVGKIKVRIKSHIILVIVVNPEG